ncbi:MULTISPECIES: dihydrofolate reductase family protein [unclassified Rathayibacter]|uniref:dihydrofolate reductase family protein n=1 Tax=unclassified Rathayibacter TaxID=2609250 RepID=UPI00188C1DB9|nr:MULTISPECIES: dihydrofolate reductase family protein [unclassified Rathayibacter]MBF4461975.1 dihydrofolate reductase family protein [Rathayibacter sp. VKM Ac-2879]MBF4503982.1 dihydrofolate reductase family protein [Rathayibacter sp. VKM Ac-2878]
MSRLVVSVLTSLDGYYEGPEHDLSTLPFEDTFNDHNLELLRRAGTLVYGSRWFRGNWDSWSAVAADDSAGDRDHEIARLVTTLDSLVISDSLTLDPDAPWAATTRIVPRDDAAAEIGALKAAGDRDLLMFGSGTTWNPLLEEGLVDELIVLVGAGLAGGGSSLYSGAPHPGLTLVDAVVLPGSELVRLRYDASSR